jgi:ABC-type uncharacterized transport system involved in gliding motility auxiliary subunit
MKNKKLETLLYSTLGVVVMFVIIVAVNAIVAPIRARVDMTADKLHTLDNGTKAILKKLDAPVEINFYFSKSETRVPPDIKAFGAHIEDLLADLKQAGNGKVIIKKFDPKPDSDDEDRANLDGVGGQPISPTERFYMGLSINMEPNKVAIPVLQPSREKLLEYDIARAISQVMNTNKPVVGIMTPLPMFGRPSTPMMARMGQQGQEPWVFYSELKRDFDVRQIPMEADKIDADVKVLLVVHPKEIKDTAQYAIDQFVLRGGKLIALLDPSCMADKPAQQGPMGITPPSSSTMDKLLKSWGLAFDTSKIVADMQFGAGPDKTQKGYLPNYIILNRKGMEQKDAIASQIDELLLVFPGAFTGTPAAGLKEEVLFKSSEKSQVVDNMMAEVMQDKIASDFKASGTNYALGVRLTGKFKTAFPEGKPKAEPDPEKKDENKDAKAEEGLKESTTENVVTLIGDVDFIYDPFCTRQVRSLFGIILVPQFGNLALSQGMVEQLSGDSSLIGARSRASINRPFDRLNEMQLKANEKHQDTIKKLEAQKQEAQEKLREVKVQRDASGGQKIILTKEQKEMIDKYEQQEEKAKKDRRQVDKDLARDTESLKTRLKIVNIAGMPFVVALTGICLAVFRKQRTKAK